MNPTNVGNGLYLAQSKITDPGNAGTFTIDKSMAVCDLVSAAAETRTLARPTKVGVQISLHCKTYVGDIVVTVTGGFDEAGTTTFTFTAAGQFADFRSYYDGTNYYWRKTSDYGVGQQLPGGVGYQATAAEIDAVADVSTRVVPIGASATTFSVTATQHAGRLIVINSTVPCAITLPQATGTGNKYEMVVSIVATATPHTIKVANATDIMAGVNIVAQTDTAQVNGFLTTATDDTISINGTTKGGLVGDKIIVIDMATGVFQVQVTGGASGTVATPFSATVGS